MGECCMTSWILSPLNPSAGLNGKPIRYQHLSMDLGAQITQYRYGQVFQ